MGLSTSKSHCLIVCNGEAPTHQLMHDEYHEHSALIAADGGAKSISEYGLKPDVVIGDMDSYHDTLHTDDVHILEDTDQETNDLEKALYYAKANNYMDCTILGATNQRIDQTLKNLSVLKQFHPYFDQLIMKDRYGDLFLLPKEYHPNLPIGTTVSLFPLSGKVTGIFLKGFRYPLHGETLENGVRDGTSNVVTKPDALITYECGDLLMFIYRPERIQNN